MLDHLNLSLEISGERQRNTENGPSPCLLRGHRQARLFVKTHTIALGQQLYRAAEMKRSGAWGQLKWEWVARGVAAAMPINEWRICHVRELLNSVHCHRHPGVTRNPVRAGQRGPTAGGRGCPRGQGAGCAGGPRPRGALQRTL